MPALAARLQGSTRRRRAFVVSVLKKNGRNLARNLARSLARNLARNVGFGKQHLAVIFAALNLLTFAFHAALDGPGGLEYQVR